MSLERLFNNRGDHLLGEKPLFYTLFVWIIVCIFCLVINFLG